MSNGVNVLERGKEEDKLEELDSLVALLKETVDNFNKDNNKSKLNEFISEYINLEDKILDKIDSLHHSKEIDSEQMENLTTTFNTYWGDYQNEWSDDYWEVYNTYRAVKDKNLVSNPIKKINIFEDSFEENQEIMNISMRQKLMPGNPETRRSTSEDSMELTTVNINKIDEELKEIGEITSIKEKKEEKKRGCLDCIIF